MDVVSNAHPRPCRRPRGELTIGFDDGEMAEWSTKFAGSKFERLIRVGSVGPKGEPHGRRRVTRAPRPCAVDHTAV